MPIHIFLLCYNEELMLPHTLRYYKSRFPSAVITIFDNYSTDRSAQIAEEAGCRVVKYDSKEQQDEQLLIWVRSHMWKKYVTEDSWVIMCDMDEWLDATEDELREQEQKGVTVLTTQGINMVGESQTADYSDIDLFDIQKGFYDNNMSKRICFKYPEVAMEYWYGAHKCFPQGRVFYSEKTYFLKHYDFLGEEYLVEKHRKRWERNQLSRLQGMNGHYFCEREKTVEVYRSALARAITVDAARRSE
jgi:glycosyltransferase involved in cell wall biosynthesis